MDCDAAAILLSIIQHILEIHKNIVKIKEFSTDIACLRLLFAALYYGIL